MVTIRDIAKKARVSTTTVSHVMNESRYVRIETADRVRQAVAALHYQPNALARSLRRKHSRTLGLVLPDSSNPFFAEVTRGIEDFAFQHGYNIIFGSSDGDLQKESAYLRVFIEKQVDGLIFVAAGDSTQHLRGLLAKHLPVVVVDREFRHVAADYVVVDNRRGGMLAAEHLIGLGHYDIACIAGPPGVYSGAERVQGYRDALKQHSMRVSARLVRVGDFSARSGFEQTQSLLASPARRPTAIFACNDMMALGALGAIYQSGLAVPDDISVVGFDDITLSSYSSPPLTTIQQPKYEMGTLAARILLEQIRTPGATQPQRYLLPTKLIVRESTQPESNHGKDRRRRQPEHGSGHPGLASAGSGRNDHRP